MKLRGTPPTEGLVGIAMHVLFCLFFLLGGLGFLCLGLSHAASLSPILETLTPGLGVGRSFEFVDNPSDGLCDMRYWNLEVEQTASHAKDATILEGLVEGIGSLNVELPLIEGELTGDVIDDLALLEAPGGDALQKVDERSQQGADNNTPGSNQGDKDGIGHNLDRESLLQGMVWALAFTVGLVVGSWIGAKIGAWLAYALPLGNVFR